MDSLMVETLIAAASAAPSPAPAHVRLSQGDVLRAIRATYYQPLSPQPFDQGDPFVLEVPEEAGTTYRFYLYTSGEPETGDGAIPVYGSDDLSTATLLGTSLVEDTPRSHWAPCVFYIPSLEFPYVMLYSRSVDRDRIDIGHQIVRAHSKRPEGPFLESGNILTPYDDFAIDADVCALRDGRVVLGIAVDFVGDAPLGTGIVEEEVSPDLTHLLGNRRVLARACSDEQVFEAARCMPWKAIPGVDWFRGDTVRWHTIEAPVYLHSPSGKRVVLYSSGCYYKGNYAVGALVEDDNGNLLDVTATTGHSVIRSQPESGLYSLGHPSYIQIAGHDFLVIHMRQGSVDAERQMTIVPLLWTEEGLPFCPTAESLAASSAQWS
jgi:hypothetical protein